MIIELKKEDLYTIKDSFIDYNYMENEFIGGRSRQSQKGKIVGVVKSPLYIGSITAMPNRGNTNLGSPLS